MKNILLHSNKYTVGDELNYKELYQDFIIKHKNMSRKEISKLNIQNNKDKIKINYFEKIANEIILNIIKNIDIKYLFNLKLISKRWNLLINQIIEKRLIYNLNINVDNLFKELKICIKCDNHLKLEKLRDKYKTPSNYKVDKYVECKCKYKLVENISCIKYINHLIIDFYDEGSGIVNTPEKTQEQLGMYEYLYKIVIFFYNNYDIYISELEYSGINYKNYRNKILNKILNNTKYKAEILLDVDADEIYNIEIINTNLEIISIPSILAPCFKEIKNIKEIDINDYIENYTIVANRCIKLFDTFNKKLERLSLFDNIPISLDPLYNKKVEILEICLWGYDNIDEYFIRSLIEKKEKYNSKRLILYIISPFEEEIRILNKCHFVDKILVGDCYSSPKYSHDYEKV